MKKKYLFIALLVCSSVLFSQPKWEQIVCKFNTTSFKSTLTPIFGGASNVNYEMEIGNKKYFLRKGMSSVKKLYSDLGIENEVLTKLLPLNVSPKPLYYDKKKALLITEYIKSNDAKPSLCDKETRLAIISMLKKIENAEITISRRFKPYEFTCKLIEFGKKRGVVFSNDFFKTMLPALKKIDEIVNKDSRIALCHLDLHSKNILQEGARYWIIDWEYAMISHPYLTLASMASIERWDDAMMKTLLIEYNGSFSQEEYDKLTQYRIAIDIFWAAWNIIQYNESPLKAPYKEWAILFREAALFRLETKRK